MSSNNLKDKISSGGEVNIIKMVVVNYAGVRIDVSTSFIELEIYESIFSNVLSGSLTILDQYNLVSNTPLIGKEIIEVVYKTPSSNEIVKTFSVYEIASNERIPGKSETFVTLKFSSKQYPLNYSTKISKSYSSKKITDMARLVFDEYLKTEDNESIIIIQDTDSETDIVIPNWSPFETLNWLAAAASYEENCDYVFFEGMGCFYFVPLSSLKTQQPTTTFEYSPSKKENISAPDVNTQLRRIESYTELSDGYKKGEMEMEGVFSSIMGVFDSTYKDLEYKFFSYIDDFDNTKKIHENPIAPLSYLIALKPTSKLYIRSDSKFLFNKLPKQVTQQKTQKRNSQIPRMHDKIIKIDIPGDSRRRVGEIVEMIIPSTEFLPIKGSESTNDPNLSGKYLVTAIGHHIVRQDGYYMGLEMMKDSYINQIPDQVKIGGG